MMGIRVDNAHATNCASQVKLDITWSGVTNIDQPVGIFIHGLDEHGQQVLAADRDLLDGYLPLDQVPPHLAVAETRLIKIPLVTRHVTQLQIGAYTRSDVKRFEALRADGSAWDDNAVTIPVSNGEGVCP
jgi:hypothetical protein